MQQDDVTALCDWTETNNDKNKVTENATHRQNKYLHGKNLQVSKNGALMKSLATFNQLFHSRWCHQHLYRTSLFAVMCTYFKSFFFTKSELLLGSFQIEWTLVFIFNICLRISPCSKNTRDKTQLESALILHPGITNSPQASSKRCCYPVSIGTCGHRTQCNAQEGVWRIFGRIYT